MSNRQATQIAAVDAAQRPAPSGVATALPPRRVVGAGGGVFVALAILVSLAGCVCPGGTCDRAAEDALRNMQAPGDSDDCQREIYGDKLPAPHGDAIDTDDPTTKTVPAVPASRREETYKF